MTRQQAGRDSWRGYKGRRKRPFHFMDHPFYVYAIVSQTDGRIYVGMSQDVHRRLAEHNAGKVKSTKGFVPWMLFFSVLVGNSEQARVMEKYYKAGSGKKKLIAILQANVS